MFAANSLSAAAMARFGLLGTKGDDPERAYLPRYWFYRRRNADVCQPARAVLAAAVPLRNNSCREPLFDNGTGNACAVAGPLLFAVLTTQLGLGGTFVAAALSALAAFLPLMLRCSGRIGEGAVPSTAWQDTVAGAMWPAILSFPGSSSWIRVSPWCPFTGRFCPSWPSGCSPGGRGHWALGSATAAGAIAGSAVALLLAAYRPKGRLVLYASLAYAATLFAFGLAEHLWLGCVLIALVGAADAVTVTVRQHGQVPTTPDTAAGPMPS